MALRCQSDPMATPTESLASYAAKHNLAPHFIGGNHLGVAPPGKVKDFVQAHDGHTVITDVRILCLPLTVYRDAYVKPPSNRS